MIKPVSYTTNGNNRPRTVREKTIDCGAKGAVIGGGLGAIYGYASKSWINSTTNFPTDVFVKKTSEHLVKNLPQEEHTEAMKIKDFFVAVVNGEENNSQLKRRILDSQELSDAIPKSNSKTTEDAVDKFFENKNDAQLKNDLLELQNKTKVDKKTNIYAAKKIISENYDAKSKKLVKSENTSDETFNLLKKVKKEVKAKNAFSFVLMGAAIFGILGLIKGSSNTTKNKRL